MSIEIVHSRQWHLNASISMIKKNSGTTLKPKLGGGGGLCRLAEVVYLNPLVRIDLSTTTFYLRWFILSKDKYGIHFISNKFSIIFFYLFHCFIVQQWSKFRTTNYLKQHMSGLDNHLNTGLVEWFMMETVLVIIQVTVWILDHSTLDHLNIRPVQYLDPHCIKLVSKVFSYFKFSTI